jgi:Domain of unknown function (DUF4926)
VIRELDVIRLTEPVENFVVGEIGTVLIIHDAGAAFEVEFESRQGETMAVRADQLELVTA